MPSNSSPSWSNPVTASATWPHMQTRYGPASAKVCWWVLASMTKEHTDWNRQPRLDSVLADARPECPLVVLLTAELAYFVAHVDQLARVRGRSPPCVLLRVHTCIRREAHHSGYVGPVGFCHTLSLSVGAVALPG